MKHIIMSASLALAALTATSANAITIAGIDFADNALATATGSSNSTFLNWNPAYDATGISDAQLISDMSDTSAGSYVFSGDAGAYIDMTFNDVSVYNGEGYDFALFFVGSGNHTGNINLLDTGDSLSFTDPTYTGSYITELFNDSNGNPVESGIFVSYFDLATLGMDGQTALNNFRLEIGEFSAVPSLFAAINTTASITPVPLPAPLLLLISGLAGLGLFGRKKK